VEPRIRSGWPSLSFRTEAADCLGPRSTVRAPAAEPVPAEDPDACARDSWTGTRGRRGLPQRPVRPVRVAVMCRARIRSQAAATRLPAPSQGHSSQRAEPTGVSRLSVGQSVANQRERTQEHGKAHTRHLRRRGPDGSVAGWVRRRPDGHRRHPAPLVKGRSGNELLDGGTDGCVGRGGSLVQAEQGCLMFGGSESYQSVVGGSAEDLPSGNGGEKLLVTGL
jgi:hypothetical protein